MDRENPIAIQKIPNAIYFGYRSFSCFSFRLEKNCMQSKGFSWQRIALPNKENYQRVLIDNYATLTTGQLPNQGDKRVGQPGKRPTPAPLQTDGRPIR